LELVDGRLERSLTLDFFTGRQHAGENLQGVLNQRLEELGPPLLMSDGLSRNDPAHTETVRGSDRGELSG